MSLERFVKAQEGSYEIALNEIRQGQKRSHWMWYIFPQIKGLGYSPQLNIMQFKMKMKLRII